MMFRNIQYERGNDPIRESRSARSSLELQRIHGAPEAQAAAATDRGHIEAAPPCSYLGHGDDRKSETEAETPEEVRLRSRRPCKELFFFFLFCHTVPYICSVLGNGVLHRS